MMQASEHHGIPIRDDGLQIQENRAFQRGFWFAERVAWALFGILILLALLGLSGAGGLLSKQSAVLANGEVAYPRVARWFANDEIQVTFANPSDRHTLTLDRRFFEYFQIDGSYPAAARSSIAPHSLTMEFEATGDAPITVILQLRAIRPGWARYELAIDGIGTAVSSVVLP